MPPISTIGLGRTELSSLIREPYPPARITAFIAYQLLSIAFHQACSPSLEVLSTENHLCVERPTADVQWVRYGDTSRREIRVQFEKISLHDARLITLTKHGDDRGFVARTFCRELFSGEGLVTEFPQANHSSSAHKGTLRGMHYQRAPHGEVKVVRVVRGAIYDVIIDLRPDSPTYLKHEGFELSDENHRMLYVPAGFAHGFQTLEDRTEVVYPVSHPYTPTAESGIRFNDPVFGIRWPLPVSTMSDKDKSWPDVDLEAGIPV